MVDKIVSYMGLDFHYSVKLVMFDILLTLSPGKPCLFKVGIIFVIME